MCPELLPYIAETPTSDIPERARGRATSVQLELLKPIDQDVA